MIGLILFGANRGGQPLFVGPIIPQQIQGGDRTPDFGRAMRGTGSRDTGPAKEENINALFNQEIQWRQHGLDIKHRERALQNEMYTTMRDTYGDNVDAYLKGPEYEDQVSKISQLQNEYNIYKTNKNVIEENKKRIGATRTLLDDPKSKVSKNTPIQVEGGKFVYYTYKDESGKEVQVPITFGDFDRMAEQQLKYNTTGPAELLDVPKYYDPDKLDETWSKIIAERGLKDINVIPSDVKKRILSGDETLELYIQKGVSTNIENLMDAANSYKEMILGDEETRGALMRLYQNQQLYSPESTIDINGKKIKIKDASFGDYTQYHINSKIGLAKVYEETDVVKEGPGAKGAGGNGSESNFTAWIDQVMNHDPILNPKTVYMDVPGFNKSEFDNFLKREKDLLRIQTGRQEGDPIFDKVVQERKDAYFKSKGVDPNTLYNQEHIKERLFGGKENYKKAKEFYDRVKNQKTTPYDYNKKMFGYDPSYIVKIMEMQIPGEFDKFTTEPEYAVKTQIITFPDIYKEKTVYEAIDLTSGAINEVMTTGGYIIKDASKIKGGAVFVHPEAIRWNSPHPNNPNLDIDLVEGWMIVTENAADDIKAFVKDKDGKKVPVDLLTTYKLGGNNVSDIGKAMGVIDIEDDLEGGKLVDKFSEKEKNMIKLLQGSGMISEDLIAIPVGIDAGYLPSTRSQAGSNRKFDLSQYYNTSQYRSENISDKYIIEE